MLLLLMMMMMMIMMIMRRIITGLNRIVRSHKLGRVAQSVGRLTCKSEVLGSIPGLAILSFFLPLIQEGQLSVTGESMCTKYW